MKLIVKILLSIVCFALVLCIIVFVDLATTRVRDTKDFSQIYVQDFFDYNMMINPPDQYSALLQIELPMRKKVAEYMKQNNLKLKTGEQVFVRINPTYKELIKDGFKFEKIIE